MEHQPSETLKSRSYIGLILSQFLAAFNDQATHIVAIFYAVDMLVRFVHVPHLAGKDVISIVTVSFILPFLLFSSIAGPLADRYSKRSILVGWKLAEVAIMGLVLLGFLLPHTQSWGYASPQTLAVISSIMVVSGVFLMGTHSTFFVPAKYGAMPELLHHSILSRGNGLLEGTSFTANILGTVCGGVLYGFLKSEIIRANTFGGQDILVPGQEWLIGLLLLALAIVGAVASTIIERLPAASPDQRHPFTENFSYMRKSRSLIVAVFGIAFFAFMTLFLRQVLLADGEAKEELEKLSSPTASSRLTPEREGGIPAPPSRLDRHLSTELKVAILIGLVGLGVGIGCASAGYLSGKKLELGLILIGAPLLVVMLVGLGFAVRSTATTSVCLILVGCSAGLYIVPMYTMLQHRAPKGSKGNLVAASNFINVAGGLFAIAVFWVMTVALEIYFGLNIRPHELKEHPELRAEFIEQLTKRPLIAEIQFFGGAIITVGMILLLMKMRPDFIVRSLYWMRMFGRPQANPDGLHHIPGFGPVILLTNAANADACLQLSTFTDRFIKFVVPDAGDGEPRLALVRNVALKAGVLVAPQVAVAPSPLPPSAADTLRAGHVLALVVPGSPAKPLIAAIENLRREVPSAVAIVDCRHADEPHQRLLSITVGEQFLDDADPKLVHTAIEEWLRSQA